MILVKTTFTNTIKKEKEQSKCVNFKENVI